MPNKLVYLTPEGAESLRQELEELTGSKREEISKRLRVAIQQGDLKENADYIATKEEQGFVEGRILEIEAILRNATIISRPNTSDQVTIGCRVTIQEADSPEETYHVVGASEANPREGRISNESPIGRALIGHQAGDLVGVQVPNGTIELKITKIE